ncbi:MAG TPA: hypothetical protein GXX20_09210 [Clostridiaceae bacterium]|nr:hypothetical protein [Clostridiaceae bacterium]
MKSETAKTYILVILIIICLIQLGILWNYQNHGFPISFLMSFFSSDGTDYTAADEKAAIEEFFVPYRIIVSNGWESHWIIGTNDKYFEQLWQNAKHHLTEALSSKKYQEFIPLEKWGECITKRGYSIEFKINIPNTLLKSLLDLENINSEDSPGLYKMMVVPGGYIGMNSTTVYVMDGKGIYKYTTGRQEDDLEDGGFEKLITKLEQSKDNNSEYKVFAELVNTERFNYSISPDVLFTYSSVYREYNNINWSVPGKIGKNEQDKLSKLDGLAKIVLGNEKDSFDHSIDSNGTILFKNLDSIFRIYNDGFFEFRYIPGTQGLEKGSISSAFISASRFLKRILALCSSDNRLFLSGILENQDHYVFTFDYLVEDIPVTFGDNITIRNYQQKNAVIMEVSRNKVIGCRWILMDFFKLKEENSYNMNTISLLEKSKLKLNEVSIRDMYVSYYMNDSRSSTILPHWIIEDRDGNIYAVQMIKKEKGS